MFQLGKIMNRCKFYLFDISVAIISGLSLLLSSGTPVRADTLDWGGSDGAWGTASNWLIGGVTSTKTPADGDTVNISSGKATMSGIVSSNLTLNLNGGDLEMNGNDFTLKNGCSVTQSAGTFSLTQSSNSWFNLGESEGGNASYTMTGGKINAVQYFIVGRRGQGTMTVSGNSTINAQTFTLGFFTQMAGNSSMTLDGGTFTVSGTSYIGGNAYQAGTHAGTNTLNIGGGTYISNGETRVGSYHSELNKITNASMNTVVNVTDGKWDANGFVYVGYGDVTAAGNSNNATVNLSGGTSNFNNEVHVGFGRGTNAVVEVSDTAQVKFKSLTQVGVGVDSIAVLKVSGGTANFDGLVKLGMGSGATGTIEVAGGNAVFNAESNLGGANNSNGILKVTGGTTNFNEIVRIGTVAGSTGTIDISGGTTTFTKQVLLGDYGTGSMEISGTANVTMNGYDFHIGMGGASASVTQTGGTFTVNSWLNIGENGKGSYSISGGTLNANANLVVGRRSEGKMTISGTADVNAKNVFVGYFPNLTGESVLTVDGGTLDGVSLFISNQNANGSSASPTKASTVTINGGTTHFTGASYIGHRGPDGAYTGGIGVLNVTGGSILFDEETTFGFGTKTSGTLNMTGGEVKFTGSSKVYVGRDSGSVGTVQLNGGTLYGPAADFHVGEGGSVAKFIVNGGTYNQNGKGNFVIASSAAVDGDGNRGPLVELQSGTIDTNWLSLGQNGQTGGLCTYTMSGGTLKIGNNFRIGFNYDAVANISGGSITVNGQLGLAERSTGTGTLNLYGSKSTWKVGSLNWTASGTANLYAGALEINADGTGTSAISNIVVTGNASVASKIRIDTTNYTYNGAGFLDDLPARTLISAGGTLTWNPASLTTVGTWKAAQNGNNIELTLDESAIASAVITSGSGIAEGVLGESGWIKLSGDANSSYNLLMHYTGEGSGDDLATWLFDQLVDANDGVTVKNVGEFIEFGNLQFDADGLGYMSYNLAEFNALNNTSLTFNNLPEPSTWILLLSGLTFLAAYKNKKILKSF